MGWYLIVATIPIVVFGALLTDQIETGARNLYLIGTTLIVLGLVLSSPTTSAVSGGSSRASPPGTGSPSDSPRHSR